MPAGPVLIQLYACWPCAHPAVCLLALCSSSCMPAGPVLIQLYACWPCAHPAVCLLALCSSSCMPAGPIHIMYLAIYPASCKYTCPELCQSRTTQQASLPCFGVLCILFYCTYIRTMCCSNAKSVAQCTYSAIHLQ